MKKVPFSLKENVMETFSKRWLTPDELESEYGFSKSTQAKMRMSVSKCKIPFCKISSKYIRYDRIAIDAWIEKHKVVGENL